MSRDERSRTFGTLSTDDEALLYASALVSDGRNLRAVGQEDRAKGKIRQARDLLDAVLED